MTAAVSSPSSARPGMRQNLGPALIATVLTFTVGTLDQGRPITIAGLQGHYLYQSDKHRLQITSVQAFNGSYQAKATLGALAPMALEAQLQAHVEQPATETLPAIVADAKAHVSGQLAGADATLRVQAQLQPQPQAAALPAANSKPGAPPLVRSAKPTASSTAPRPICQ